MRLEIKILPGTNKTGDKESFDEIIVQSGDVIAVVGPTGSGKSTLLNDIDIIAQGDTNSGRVILVNGKVPDPEILEDPSKKLMVLITQHTNFLADILVEDFLKLHIQARGKSKKNLVDKIIYKTNLMTGEKIDKRMRMTDLSGGQSRSLMIADAVIVGDVPIILLDEIENAGILKSEALAIVKEEDKILFFVTHDPVISLCAHSRLILGNGSIIRIIKPLKEEELAKKVALTCDEINNILREKIRSGEILFEHSMDECLNMISNIQNSLQEI